jgi:predicted DNA-binding transcriptional regulator AlpA
MPPPPVVGLTEIATLVGLTKSRVSQLVETKTFPDHWVRLQSGRIWLTESIVEWAKNAGRTVDFGALDGPRPLEKVPKTESRGGVESVPHVEPTETHVVIIPPGGGEDPSPSEKAAGIFSRFAPSDTDEAALAEPEKPSRRDSAELNNEALRTDFDQLLALATSALKGDAIDLDDRELVGFAVMVITAEANVPNYRKTKTALVKAWGQVRKAHGTTATEEATLAKYVVENASTPFTPGAVKRFSDYEITKMRRGERQPQSVEEFVKNAPPGTTHRWQGGHYGQHDAINAELTPEEKKRYGVQE